VPFYVNACEEMGIEVLPPDVNSSAVDFAVVEGKIRFGLNAVKNVGDAAARSLVAAREAGATTVLFSGGDGGPAAEHSDHALLVPSTTTARIQEMHLLLLHQLVERVDAWAAGELEEVG
jgi:DNA polymerase III alpha subunit